MREVNIRISRKQLEEALYNYLLDSEILDSSLQRADFLYLYKGETSDNEQVSLIDITVEAHITK